jgi:hypothetical protein
MRKPQSRSGRGDEKFPVPAETRTEVHNLHLSTNNIKAQFQSENLKGIGYLEDVGENGRIILKQI